MSEQLKARISEAIKSLAEGHGATIDAVVAQTDLLALACVVAEATGADRSTVSLEEVAAVVVLFLGEATDSLEEHPEAPTKPNRSIAARVALGLADGMQGKPLRGKRGTEGRVAALARWLAYEPASLFHQRSDGRSVFDVLIDDIAEHLFRREVEYLVNAQRLVQRARRPPLESAMRIDWLARFEVYYKMWSPASGVRHDLEMALRHRRQGETADAELFTRKSLFYYAVYLTQLECFADRYGGLWILPNTKTENAIADSSWLIRKPIPLSEVDESILRLTLATHAQLALFMHATFAVPHLQPIVCIWRDWIHACKCARPRRPRQDCKVHQAITWITLYMDALDEQWDSLADWYQHPRPGTVVDPLTIADGTFPLPPSSKLTE